METSRLVSRHLGISLYLCASVKKDESITFLSLDMEFHLFFYSLNVRSVGKHADISRTILYEHI